MYFEGASCSRREDPVNPVVVEGVAELQTAPAVIARFLGLLNAKYEHGLRDRLPGPAHQRHDPRASRRGSSAACEEDFTGSATCWRFEAP